MPIPVCTTADLDEHLAALGVVRGHHVVVHSRLVSLGILQGGAMQVLGALERAVGPDGTFVVPGYTFSLRQSDVFDVQHSQPEGMGALSTCVWERSDRVRSPCPIHSHLAIGQKAGLLAGMSGLDSVGPGSDFALFRREGFHSLMLGLDFDHGCSYLHHVESMCRVPYRQELKLSRRRMEADGSVSEINVDYFGYPSGPRQWQENLNVVEARMAVVGALRHVRCAFGFSSYCAVESLHQIAAAMVTADPWCLVKPVVEK